MLSKFLKVEKLDTRKLYYFRDEIYISFNGNSNLTVGDYV